VLNVLHDRIYGIRRDVVEKVLRIEPQKLRKAARTAPACVLSTYACNPRRLEAQGGILATE